MGNERTKEGKPVIWNKRAIFNTILLSLAVSANLIFVFDSLETNQKIKIVNRERMEVNQQQMEVNRKLELLIIQLNDRLHFEK
ncbi:hypothetical protein [Brevibacillus laterosporus]|uniref:hypothetical protein n=1 Tax=Brevibacillus laterosporus TaxID=1465 RepID=UPI001EF2C6E5|nr:hypothetical protein [Brevibacillus laterosporus]MCG7318036.1 hypothetical protein [Brevibacillus laterosporus]